MIEDRADSAAESALPAPEPPADFAADASSAQSRDYRLYAPSPQGWEAHIKEDWEKDYCFSKNEGEDFFHLLQFGEIYVQRAREKYCLNCALKLHILSEDRLHWQNRAANPPVYTDEGM